MWSRKYDKCIKCGKTDRPHASKGVCQRCYYREYISRNKDKISAYWEKYKDKDSKNKLKQRQHEQKLFEKTSILSDRAIETIEDKLNCSFKKFIGDNFIIYRKHPKEIAQELKNRTGIDIPWYQLKKQIASYQLIIPKRKGFSPIKPIRWRVMSCFGMDIDDFINKHYFEERMSCEEIRGLIKEKTGYDITRQCVWFWIYDTGYMARSNRQAFNVAVDKKRFNHQVVAEKINYKKRNIVYDHFQFKKIDSMKKHSSESTFAFGLKKTLLDKRKTHEQLADFLGVSIHSVKSWCALNNRVNEIYWEKICKFLEESFDKIFQSGPTQSQLNKLDRRGVYLEGEPFVKEGLEELKFRKQLEQEIKAVRQKYILEGRRWLVNVKDRIVQMGLKVEDVAKAIKMTKDSLKLMANQDIMVKPKDQERIAAYFGVNPEEIFSEEKE